jgi:uncharacterized protein YkwD
MPTRRAAVTTGCVTIAAVALAVIAAQGPTSPTAAASLAAHRAPATTAASRLFAGLPSRTPTILPPTVPGGPGSPTASPTVIVVPAPPNPAPARGNAATVAPVANTNNGGAAPRKSTSTTKKASSGGGSNGGGAAPAGSGYPERADIANAIYNLINQERAQNGLAALGRSGQLNSSAHGHNVAMANSGDFAHQVPGEASLGPRISATGYHWTSAGENIAWGSYASVSFGESLETEMYNEPPNQENHRANILSSSFHNVGVDVITDGSGKMWITCDFGS